jgi:hypothetical protein
MTIDFLSFSPVSNFREITSCFTTSSGKLSFEEIKILFSDWIYGAQNIPVNKCRAWRSSDRTLVSPSVVKINQFHKISVRNKVDNWVCESISCSSICGISLSCLIPLKTLEESIDDFYFSVCKFNIDFGVFYLDSVYSVYSEQNSYCSSQGVFNGGSWIMISLHFQIKSLSINSMFRSSMEVKLGSCIVSISIKNFFSKVGLECTNSIRFVIVDIDGTSMSIPDNFVVCLIPVQFLCLILRSVIDCVCEFDGFAIKRD